MRAAALDYGTVRIGLAVADELGMLAHPRPFIEARPPRRALERLAELVEQEGITLLLVGLPRTLRGEEGMAAKRARRFASELKRRVGIPVELVDERLTTREATERLRAQGLSERERRSRVDSAAAAILLQSWLDARRGEPHGRES